MKERKIYTFLGGETPAPLGVLYVGQEHAREVYSFSFAASFLREHETFLDPHLSFFPGRQYAPVDALFGMFQDAAPDRWGRVLMKKREAIRAREAGEKPRKLQESDFLLGVYDEGRMGALRLALAPDGPFLSDDTALAAPPWVQLRALEDASHHLENDDEIKNGHWLDLLLAPGSSLGGARPKAPVKAPDGSLWLAKFPSRHDEVDVGAWEMVAHDLAAECGLRVPEAKCVAFSKRGSTFLVRRFDREGKQRIPFASGMTMLGRQDNDHDASYLDLLDFILQHNIHPKEAEQELWKRIVFNLLISNTDDHLRNHGFLLMGGGWTLSPLYDVNPIPYGHELSLNITYDDATMSLVSATETAPLYEIAKSEAERLISDMARMIVQHWQQLAKKYHIKNESVDRMRPAFSLAETAATS